MLNLQTKRGCPFKCIYCTFPLIEGRRFRLVPPEEVAETAKRLQDAGARYLFITDATFNGSQQHSLQVAAAFQKAGVSIPWGALFTPLRDHVPDYYRILADAGLRHVEFGTEALSNPVLEAYGKPFRIEEVVASHRAATAANLHVAHYLMLGGPGETLDTVRETLAAADGLERTVFFVFNGIRIYPRTGLHDLAVQEGQLGPQVDLLEPSFYWSPKVPRETINDLVRDHADKRKNWVVGAVSPQTLSGMARLQARGQVGPMWEHMIR